MSLFNSESDMQAWLSSELRQAEGMADLIVNLDEFGGLVPTDFSESRLLESIRSCLASLYINRVFSENENISINDLDILKPDFVLYAPETESLVIVELKNLGGPSRQAGTELSAYTCEIRSAIPFIADGDVVNVIISSEWPALLKHYARQEIFWQRRNLICLRPVMEGENKRLKILGLSDLSEGGATLRISERYLGGYQVCLYDNDLYSPSANRSRLKGNEEQFKTALQAMVTMGNRLNSHGFAFLWKDRWQESLAPYSITVMNFAPFQCVERFFHLESDCVPQIIKRFIALVKENCPEGHGNTLGAVTDTAMALLKNVCSPRMEGFANWGAHREIMSRSAESLAFVGWGLFGEATFARLQKEYESGNTTCRATDPKLGFSVVSEIVDDSYQFVDLNYIDFGD